MQTCPCDDRQYAASSRENFVGVRSSPALQIQSDISAYLVTITAMNALVDAATGFVMWSTGVGDLVLWGTVAFLLNFAPISRPAAGLVIFLLAGQVFQVTLTSGNRNGYDRPLAVMLVWPELDQFRGGVLGVVEFSGVDESITALAAASIWALQSLQRRVMSGSCWENGGHRVDIALPRGRRNAQNTVDDESERLR